MERGRLDQKLVLRFADELVEDFIDLLHFVAIVSIEFRHNISYFVCVDVYWFCLQCFLEVEREIIGVQQLFVDFVADQGATVGKGGVGVVAAVESDRLLQRPD